MANVLNNMLSNPNINKPPVIDVDMSTKYRTKPSKPTAKLMPSRIIGSPVEAVKDFTKDILSIKKAVKGEANDYELGRINSLALKLGSVGIASYLFVKNPLKLSKTMEITGLAAFFGSMALWPKLAIQLPIKARTGVDFQQEYVDSQGRKKSLYQDNQYVLDLYSREELDTIGDKMNVNKNLPDRDSYIKQRAQKTALQANTLWMATAGVATPVMSGLICNVSEKYLKPVIEKYELYRTQNNLDNYNKNSDVIKSETKKKIDTFVKFLEKNKQNKIDDKMIEQISKEFDSLVFNDGLSMMLEDGYKADLKNVLSAKVDENLIKNAFGEGVIEKLPKAIQTRIKWIKDNPNVSEAAKIDQLVRILSSQKVEVTVNNEKTTLNKLGVNGIKQQLTNSMQITVGDSIETLKNIYSTFAKYIEGKKVLDEYVNARIGDIAGSYNANSWERVGEKIINMLELDSSISTTELEKIAKGDITFIEEKFKEFCKSENYEKTINEFIEFLDDYNTKMNGKAEQKGIIDNIRTFSNGELNNNVEKNAAYNLFETFRKSLEDLGCKNTSKMVSNSGVQAAPGTLYRTYEQNNLSRISPNRATFYRLMQAFNLFKKTEESGFDEKLCKIIDDVAWDTHENCTEYKTKESLEKIKQTCKNILMRALTTDQVEELSTRGFQLDSFEYKVVMKLLTNEDDADIFTKYKGKKDISGLVADYKKYLQEFRHYIGDYINPMNPNFKNNKISSNGHSDKNCAKRSQMVGESIFNMVIKQAKKSYNTKRWQILFGGVMAGLTTGTLFIGSFLGGKTHTEKIAEKELKESRKNVKLH